MLAPGARLGRGTRPAYALIREKVPFLPQDDVMYPHIESVRKLVSQGELRLAVERVVGAGCAWGDAN